MDVITIAVQVTGAALVGVVQTRQSEGKKPPVTTKTANNILLAGLAVQTAFFTVFLTLLLTALARVSRIPAQYNLRRNARIILLVDLAAALLVLLRTVYRLAVECQGYFGSANSSQVLYTCLEYLPVILAMAVFAAVPLYRFLPSAEQKYAFETDTDPADLAAYAGGDDVKDTYSATLEQKRSLDRAPRRSQTHHPAGYYGQQGREGGYADGEALAPQFSHGQQYEHAQFADPRVQQHQRHPQAQTYQETNFGGPAQYR